ncbi:hypothetical protein [Parabacteroides sp. FAFU027]|uniref:hypothetical protein n=1 Tax=Parabacteroides sp. FAFU027 TaxID=2922715 RepID=UPI001FAFE8B0|nr:hypothetical protein [Parabacteroides sp. FAFU027]
MKVDLLNEKLRILKKKMEGFNYEVSLHFDLFEQVIDLGLIKDKIKTLYPKAYPDFDSLTLTDYGDLKIVVSDCFDYRVDSGAGLELNEKEEKELKLETLEFWNAFDGFIAKDNTDFYIYPNETGLSIYPVWWDFEYLIIDNKNQNSVLFYGAASD